MKSISKQDSPPLQSGKNISMNNKNDLKFIFKISLLIFILESQIHNLLIIYIIIIGNNCIVKYHIIKIMKKMWKYKSSNVWGLKTLRF